MLKKVIDGSKVFHYFSKNTFSAQTKSESFPLSGKGPDLRLGARLGLRRFIKVVSHFFPFPGWGLGGPIQKKVSLVLYSGDAGVGKENYCL